MIANSKLIFAIFTLILFPTNQEAGLRPFSRLAAEEEGEDGSCHDARRVEQGKGKLPVMPVAQVKCCRHRWGKCRG